MLDGQDLLVHGHELRQHGLVEHRDVALGVGHPERLPHRRVGRHEKLFAGAEGGLGPVHVIRGVEHGAVPFRRDEEAPGAEGARQKDGDAEDGQRAAREPNADPVEEPRQLSLDVMGQVREESHPEGKKGNARPGNAL